MERSLGLYKFWGGRSQGALAVGRIHRHWLEAIGRVNPYQDGQSEIFDTGGQFYLTGWPD